MLHCRCQLLAPSDSYDSSGMMPQLKVRETPLFRSLSRHVKPIKRPSLRSRFAKRGTLMCHPRRLSESSRMPPQTIWSDHRARVSRVKQIETFGVWRVEVAHTPNLRLRRSQTLLLKNSTIIRGDKLVATKSIAAIPGDKILQVHTPLLPLFSGFLLGTQCTAKMGAIPPPPF